MRALAFLILFFLMVLLFPSQATQIIGFPSAQPVTQDLRVERIDLQADASGNFHQQTPSPLIGELHSIAYVNGNFTGSGTVSIETATPSGWVIDSYNLSTGNALRFPGGLVYGSADYYVPYYLFSKVWINMTLMQANRSATIYLMWG